MPTSNLSHTDAAQAFIEQLRAMRDTIPNFVIPAARREILRLTAAASVPPDFIELTVAATKNSIDLARGGATDPDRVRDLMGFAEAYGPVADELEAMTQFLKHSVAAAKNKAGRHALVTYSVTKRLAKAAETSYLAPVAEAMRHKLGKKGKKAQAAPDTPTTPAPTPETPSNGTPTA